MFFPSCFFLFTCSPLEIEEEAQSTREEQGGGISKKRRIEEVEAKEKNEETEEEEEQEEVLPALTTLKEVKEAFEEFLSRVPEPMVSKLHKLIREREGATDQEEADAEAEGHEVTEEDQSLIKGDELIFSIREELRKRLPVSAQAPNEEFFFNKSSGV